MSFFKIKPNHCPDAAFVDGVYRCNPAMERGLHRLCKEYYEKNFHKPEIGEEGKKDIFQSSLLALWNNIRNRKLYVEDGELRGKDGSLFTSTLTTYFMGIVNNKTLEWLRKNPIAESTKTKTDIITESISEDIIDDFNEDDETLRRKRIIFHRVSHMAKRCNRILTLFYYEEKDYDEIMFQMPSFKSKDALKTAKYKCLKQLRESVNGTYC